MDLYRVVWSPGVFTDCPSRDAAVAHAEENYGMYGSDDMPRIYHAVWEDLEWHPAKS